MRACVTSFVALTGTFCVFTAATVAAADAPSVKLALSFKPVQQDVEYESPKESELSQCKVEGEREGPASGWIVRGPAGQTLRRFVDTNGDNVVDQWRYYQHGIEVYRDIDADFNNKVDQCRWVNVGGSRWGLDRDEDGTIDEWKVISAEEVSREVVRALATGDVSILRPLLLTETDLKTLGIASSLQKKILDSLAKPGEKLHSARSNATGLTEKTTWVRFNATQPGMIPADSGKADSELFVYENAMAITDTDGKAGLLQLGEMVQVGRTWKLTQIPQTVDDNDQIAAGGFLMQPDVAGSGADGGGISGSLTPKMQQLLADLQKIDEHAPGPSDAAQAFARYNARRASILQKLIDESSNQKDKNQWRRQMVDGLAAAVQTGAYSDGLSQLQTIEANIRRENPQSPLVPYVAFRRLLAEYTVRLQKASADERPQVQEWWLKQLEDFANTWPNAEDAPEAMTQLAIALEFSGKLDEARKWYGKAVKTDSGSTAGQRAAGALHRIDLNGKPLKLSGKGLGGGTVDISDYRGRVVLVIFWSSWCKPCTEDLPQIKELYKTYRGSGFEILGVNVDVTADPAKAYIARHGNNWQHIHEEGGLDSGPARQFGIISLPTMFLVDRTGKVVSRSTTVESLKKSLPALLKNGG